MKKLRQAQTGQATYPRVYILLKIEPGVKVKKILNDIELNILNGDLNNNREELLEYIKKNWEW